VKRRFWKTFGPGLLWAATAIGVSHLVQSTRAGAEAGFSLVWIVLLALVVKYPFFEYGPRYAAATRESLVDGYMRLGRWAVWVYLLITLATAVIIQSAIALFTAFLFTRALGVDWSVALMGGAVLAGCGLLLWIGRFRALDVTIKVVLLALAGCTVVGALLALPQAADVSWRPWPLENGGRVVTFAFILALAGWMPSAIDISVWSSLWTLAKDRAAGVRTTVPEALLDFRVGYAGTGLIALAFLTLGAAVMHASGESFSGAGTAFSLQLVNLYAGALGEWSRPIITIAVVTVMFSTILAVMDGFPRAIARSIHVLRLEMTSGRSGGEQEGPGYWVALVVLAALTWVVLRFFTGNLTTMIDFATIVSFITAPVLGWLNLRVISSDHVPVEHRPGAAMRAFSRVGLFLMAGTAAVFVFSLVI
jgi:Mn2+/Fe2+ NRAMP family transporter